MATPSAPVFFQTADWDSFLSRKYTLFKCGTKSGLLFVIQQSILIYGIKRVDATI